MESIKYIGYYSEDNNRYSFPSAVAKMQYIFGALNEIGVRVQIISPCRLKIKTGKWEKTKDIKVNDMTTLHICGSFPEKNKLFRTFQIIYSSLWLFFYLVFKVKRSETILSYHVVLLDKIVMAAKKVKGFKVILEVGEIFNDVENVALAKRNQEIDTIHKADLFMYSTELLNEVCNPLNKSYVVVQGSYKVQRRFEPLFSDGKIHIVYAGILRKDKGVDVALNLAHFLDEKYVIHILGYGEERDIDRVKEEINKVGTKSGCKAIYEGLMSGDRYNQFIQSCDFGLCTQSANVSYNTTAFPSKVISYLSNGVPVIAVRIKSLEYSEVNHLIKLYENEEHPEEQIAGIIREYVFSNDNKERIRMEINRLDESFKQNLLELLD